MANADVYQRITDQIVASIEAGAGEYKMPWHTSAGAAITGQSANVVSGRAYRGVNALVLWMAEAAKGYTSPLWGTYKQWAEKGAQVRKGERSTEIVFVKRFDPKENADGSLSDPGFMMRGYSVFNLGQVDGYVAKGKPAPVPTRLERVQHADDFFRSLGASVNHGGNSAHYMPSLDRITMPLFDQFKSAEAYYSVFAHEHAHWTSHATRLDRDLSKARFGNEGYAMEELVAELTAAFTMATLALDLTPRADHAAYIANWLRVLKNDKRAIFTAASAAQKAADYLAERGDINPAASGGDDDEITLELAA